MELSTGRSLLILASTIFSPPPPPKSKFLKISMYARRHFAFDKSVIS